MRLSFAFYGQSENHNLKYMGIDALGRIIKINPEFAEQHQLAVIDCLEVGTSTSCGTSRVLQQCAQLQISHLNHVCRILTTL